MNKLFSFFAVLFFAATVAHATTLNLRPGDVVSIQPNQLTTVTCGGTGGGQDCYGAETAIEALNYCISQRGTSWTSECIRDIKQSYRQAVQCDRFKFECQQICVRARGSSWYSECGQQCR